MKEWREVQGLKNVLYPEVLDSITILTLKEHGSDDELSSVCAALATGNLCISQILAKVIT